MRAATLLLIACCCSIPQFAGACLGNYGLRELIRITHRTANETGPLVQDPVRLNTSSKQEIVQQLLSTTTLKTGLMDRQMVTTVSMASTVITTTKKLTFDDAQFIPGDFLDPSGQAKYVTPRVLSDVLADFMHEIDKRQNVLWRIAVYVLLNWCLQGTFIVLAAWVLGLFVPMYSHTEILAKFLPMEEDDRSDKMLELAELFDQNPLRFCHLPGFEIKGFNPEGPEDNKVKQGKPGLAKRKK